MKLQAMAEKAEQDLQILKRFMSHLSTKGTP